MFPPNTNLIKELLNVYMKSRTPYWESLTGRAESAVSSLSLQIKTVFSAMMSPAKEKKIEHKNEDLSMHGLRKKDCDEFVKHVLPLLTSVSGCINACIAIGENATRIQKDKPSLFVKFLHAIRCIIITSIKSSSPELAEFERIIKEKHEKTDKTEKELLDLAYLGHDETLKNIFENTELKLLNMYSYPDPHFYAPVYSTTKSPDIISYRPWYFQECFHEILFREEVHGKHGYDYATIHDFSIATLTKITPKDKKQISDRKEEEAVLIDQTEEEDDDELVADPETISSSSSSTGKTVRTLLINPSSLTPSVTSTSPSIPASPPDIPGHHTSSTPAGDLKPSLRLKS